MIFLKTFVFLTILTLMIFHQNNFAQTPPLETGVSQTFGKMAQGELFGCAL